MGNFEKELAPSFSVFKTDDPILKHTRADEYAIMYPRKETGALVKFHEKPFIIVDRKL